LIEYVKKLDRLVGQSRSAAQKATYEAKLSAKKEAAAHKAKALFNRAREEAFAESTARLKEQGTAVHRAADEELEGLKAEYGGKLERADASYHSKLERISAEHQKREEFLQEQIASLRTKKTKAGDPGLKEQIQAHIERVAAERNENRVRARNARADARSAYHQQREGLHEALGAKEAAVTEAAEATIEKIAKHWKRFYNGKKASLNSRRESQLADLNVKLERGRADIATMPATG